MACHGDSGGTLVLIAASDTPREIARNAREGIRAPPARRESASGGPARPHAVVNRRLGHVFCHANLRSDITSQDVAVASGRAASRGLRHVPLPPRD